MRVLLLSFNWVEYLIEMANALVARGHDVEVGFKTERVHATVEDRLDELLDRRVRYHLLDDRARGLRDVRQLATIARVVGMLRNARPDVVHVHEASTTYLPLCLRVGTRAPVVLTIHDVARHPGADSAEPARRDRVRRYLRERASAVILHGKALEQQYLAEPDGGCRSTYVIPHGCYTTFKAWARDNVAEISHSALFFGRLNEYKGLPVLLEAAEIVAKRLPSFRVIIAGAGSDLNRYGDALDRNPLCIVHRGYLPNAKVAEVFQQSSVVVLPYVEGSQSGVVRIAYVFGKPVIVTDVGSLAEAVRPGATGLVIPPRDPQALANAILAVLGDDERRRAMSAAASRMPLEDLSWASVAEKTEQVYHDVLARRAA